MHARLWGLVLAMAVPVGAGACRRAGVETPRVIRVATLQEPDALLPWFSETAGSAQVVEAGVRHLTHYDRSWRVVPALAAELPTLKNGGARLLDAGGKLTSDASAAVRMDVTWKLRPATWSDGKPVTAGDFVAAHRWVMDPAQQVRDRSMAEKVSSMEAPDARTLVVHWKEPYAFFHAYRNHALLPAHALPSIDAGPVDLRTSALARAPLSSGPFALLQWEPGQFIRLQRNAHASPAPRASELVFQFVASDRAAVNALESGTVDAIAPDGTVGVDQVEDLVARRPGVFTADYQPGSTWAHVVVNMDHPWLADVRMRRALFHAMDRERAVNAVFRGRYQVANALFPVHHAGGTPVLSGTFQPDRARALLDELGFKPGADGVRVNAAGEKLSLELVYATGIKTTEDLLAILQQNLRDVGIQLQLVGQPARVLLGDTLKKRTYRHLAFYALSWDPMSFGDTVLGSRFIPSEKNGFSGQNAAGYRSDVVDGLVERIPRTLDDTQRGALLAQLGARVMEDLPLLPMYSRPVVSITRAGFQQWLPTGTPTPVTWNCESWDVPTAPR